MIFSQVKFIRIDKKLSDEEISAKLQKFADEGWQVRQVEPILDVQQIGINADALSTVKEYAFLLAK